MSRKLVLALCMMLLLTTVAGCWNRREPDDLAHALALGFDLDEHGHFVAYVQLTNPTGASTNGSSSSGQSGSDSAAFWTVSAAGRTPFEAMFNTSPFITRELSVAHVAVVIISEQLARRGIGPILDLMERERTMRISARILVADGDLEKLMTVELPLEEMSAEGISKAVSSSQRERSVLPFEYVSDVIDTMAQPGKEALLPRIMLLTENIGDGSSSGPTQKPPLKVAGAAAFKKDKMVGWMDEREVRGWAFLTDRVHRAIMVVELPDTPEGDLMTAVVTQVNSKLRLTDPNTPCCFALKIFADGRIEDKMGDVDFLRSREKTASMNRRIASAIQNDIMKSVHTAQALNSDVFGLGWMLYRHEYQYWQRVKDRWDEIFPRVTVGIDVRVDVRRSGLVVKMGPKK